MDPELFAQLNKYSNKNMHIDITNLPVPSLYLLFKNDEIFLTTKKLTSVDVHLSADLTTFTTILIQRFTQENALPNNIGIKGDIEFAQDIFHFFSKFEIDWEEQVANIFGDTIASQVGKGIRSFTQYTRNSFSICTQNIREYLQEEVQLLTSRLEIEDFNQDVDLLRFDIDRLAARIERLGNV
jgi:ubiquinone biosynthesis protein UbiJ